MGRELESIDPQVEARWRNFLEKGEISRELRLRSVFRMLPKNPRCKNCNAPFEGIGTLLVRTVYGKRPSKLNPRLCNVCEEFANKYQGGAEIELSLLFADIRGSTTIAEKISTTEFSRLIDPRTS